MAVPPAKLKAFVALIKEQIIDKEEETTIQQCFSALIRLELAQRGVLVAEADENDDKVGHLFQAMQSTAGKPLLSESSPFPKPLLAGTAAMAGKVAEKAASLCSNNNNNNNNNPPSLPGSMTQVQGTKQRCQKVQETRFLALLELSEHVTVSGLAVVAEGYFLRAASFQPDGPQFWKRAWDMQGLRSSLSSSEGEEPAKETTTSWQASQALEQLKRIAASKGNTKRVTELSLLLAEAYLDTSPVSFTSGTPSSLIQAFCGPFRNLEPLVREKALTKSRQELKSIPESNLASPVACLQWYVLRVELDLAQRQCDIEAQVQEEKDKAQRRSANVSTVSLEEQVGRQYTLQQTSAVGNEAVQLRDFVLDHPREDQEEEEPTFVAFTIRAWNALTQTLLNCRTYGQVKHEPTYWNEVASFAKPFWNSTDITVDKETQKVVFLLVPCISWRLLDQLNDARDGDISLATLERTIVVLDGFLVTAQQSLEEAQSSTVGSSGSSQQQLNIWALKLAHLSTRALILLWKKDAPSGGDIRSLTEDVLRIMEQRGKQSLPDPSIGSSAAEFGTWFLVLILCWSGLSRPGFEFMTSKEALWLVSETRNTITNSKDWKRSFNPPEELLLLLAEADASLTKHQTTSCYRRAFSLVKDASSTAIDPHVASLVRAHCLRSLAADAQTLEESFVTVDEETLLEMARQSVVELDSIDIVSDKQLHPWRSPELLKEAVQFQLSSSRHQIADSLILFKRYEEAETLLKKTAAEFPKDAQVAFALGSFLLRMDFSGEVSSSEDKRSLGSKESQVHLLKAAKLDGTKAGPFALLGYWYESHGDTKRAIGCFSKALVLDPAQPVAGRGLLRLVAMGQLKKVLDAAIESQNPLSGWAFMAAGKELSQNEANYEKAVVALLRAARSRDIDKPETDKLGFFYSGPRNASPPNRDSVVVVLSLIGQCYRFLGRFTAALRTFYSALDETGEEADGSLLCACGQVEVELGLFQEATKHFTRSLESPDKGFELTATLGLGVAFLSIAQVELQDGKAGAALECLEKAISWCDEIKPSHSAISLEKLCGDLHSFAAFLPLRAFDGLASQIKFVAEGENYYRKAEELAIRSDLKALQASLVSDCATNILLRAQLLGQEQHNDNQTAQLERAAEEFRRALELDSTHAPAWCGLGCALRVSPLLAQHALCRSAELDTMSPDPFGNLGFLYTAQSAYQASKNVSSALTQVADTPMMWLNTAFLLEKDALGPDVSKEKLLDTIHHTADAFRASLQVTTEPSALIGLAANGLLDLTIDERKRQSTRFSEWDTKGFAEEYSSVSTLGRVSETVNQTFQDYEHTFALEGENLQKFEKTKQKILLEPYRADLWLELAKEILCEPLDAQNDSNRSDRAYVAASKAVRMLQSNLQEPPHLAVQERDAKEEYVKADTLSDALVLRSCMQPQGAEEEETKSTESTFSSKDLQQALIVSPWNKLARQTLVG